MPPRGYLDTGGVLTTIEFPSADAVRTIPQDINNLGHIAGFFLTPQNKTVGFLLRGGAYQRIEIPGARFVTVLGMNDSDQLVGHFSLESDDIFTRRGFLWSEGQLSPIDYPGIDYAAGEQTMPHGIGRDGTIVGSFAATLNGYRKQSAFVLRNGQFTTLGIPGVMNNTATGINTRGEISGGYDAFEVDLFSCGVVGFTGVGWVLRR